MLKATTKHYEDKMPKKTVSGYTEIKIGDKIYCKMLIIDLKVTSMTIH